jgi:fatty acid desaturase
MNDPRRFLTAEELRGFHEIRPAPIAARALTSWALVLGAIWAWAASGNLVVLAAGVVVVSASQHALFLLAHDGAHDCLARRRRLNDLVADACFAGPLFTTTTRYRAGHLPHHAHLGDPRLDLEWRIWVLLRRGHFARLLVRGLTGWQAARAIVRLTPEKLGVRESPVRWLAFVGLSNGGLLAFSAAVGAPFAYVWLWLLPLFTLTYVLLIVRAVAEHQPLGYARRATEDPNVDLRPAPTRTFAAGPVERFLFAPVGAHHHEHHLFPGVPFAQLPRLHATLRARGYFDSEPDCIQTSYWSLLRRMVLLPRGEMPVSCAR